MCAPTIAHVLSSEKIFGFALMLLRFWRRQWALVILKLFSRGDWSTLFIGCHRYMDLGSFLHHVDFVLFHHSHFTTASSCWFFCILLTLCVCFCYILTPFKAIDERAWWNGKDQCKTLCCSGRSDTWALQKEWGNTHSLIFSRSFLLLSDCFAPRSDYHVT